MKLFEFCYCFLHKKVQQRIKLYFLRFEFLALYLKK